MGGPQALPLSIHSHCVNGKPWFDWMSGCWLSSTQAESLICDAREPSFQHILLIVTDSFDRDKPPILQPEPSNERTFADINVQIASYDSGIPIPMYGCCPHTKQFSDISLVSYHPTQSWHYLPNGGIRFHRLRAQNHKTALHFRCELQVQVVTCASDLLATGQRVPWLHPWDPLISRAVHRIQETSSLTRSPVY